MNIRNLYRAYLTALILLLTQGTLGATVKLSDNLFILYGGGGKGANVGIIVSPSSLIVIDTMVSDSRDLLLKELSAISDKEVSLVLNTHDHFDHSGNNHYFSGKQVDIIRSIDFDGTSNKFIAFQGELVIKQNERIIKGYNVRSHSNSDILYHLPEDNAVFLGDIYTDEWYPSFFSGGIEGQVAAIEKALSLGDENTRYIPGHGKIASRDDLQRYSRLCVSWHDRIVALHKQGLSPSDMTKDQQLRKIRESFANEKTNRENFDRWFEKLVENTLNSHLSLSSSAH